MTHRDRVLIWLLIIGLVVGGYETMLAFAQRQNFRPVVFAIALAAFAVGLVGFIAAPQRTALLLQRLT
jgi:hypothetical protein